MPECDVVNTMISIRLKFGETEGYQLYFPINQDGINAKVDANVTLEYTEYGVAINTTLQCKIDLVCTRCLDIITRDLTLEHYIVLAESGKSWEVDDETLQMGVIDFQNNTFNVYELARQLLIENTEMQTLCSDDCKGLCPVCGENLNHTQCQCNNEQIDPRWSSLKKIVFNKEDKGEV